MIRFKHSGDFKQTEKFFARARKASYLPILEKYGQDGVNALMAATPVRSGKTASSWGYEITENERGPVIHWTNSNINDGVNIALILQYGHGTGTGGYVQGIDYINPAIRPIFEKIANDAWREVTQG